MFETEDQLMAVFDTAIADSGLWLGLPGRRTFLMDEVEGIHGRVDRMMVSLPSSLRPTKTRSQLLQQETCCRIIVALRARQPKVLAQLAVDTGRSRETIRFWLSRMTDADLVRVTSTGSYILGPKSDLPDCEIWCFEGKLRDWKRALYQATRYRAFAHRSFVVMPDDLIQPAERQVDRFRLARVGLMSLDADGRFRMITKPRSQLPRSPVMFTMAQGRALACIA
ncbi:MAG: hypothetical protein HND58_15330 [Planctomycetota bacterium]|nr:MAG: hypothetical protein HND58_15330 [Planctomycetota bacterium]